MKGDGSLKCRKKALSWTKASSRPLKWLGCDREEYWQKMFGSWSMEQHWKKTFFFNSFRHNFKVAFNREYLYVTYLYMMLYIKSNQKRSKITALMMSGIPEGNVCDQVIFYKVKNKDRDVLHQCQWPQKHSWWVDTNSHGQIPKPWKKSSEKSGCNLWGIKKHFLHLLVEWPTLELPTFSKLRALLLVYGLMPPSNSLIHTFEIRNVLKLPLILFFFNWMLSLLISYIHLWEDTDEVDDFSLKQVNINMQHFINPCQC